MSALPRGSAILRAALHDPGRAPLVLVEGVEEHQGDVAHRVEWISLGALWP